MRLTISLAANIYCEWRDRQAPGPFEVSPIEDDEREVEEEMVKSDSLSVTLKDVARIEISDATNTVCTDLEVRQIGAVTAAHIHRGGAGVNGPPVITLDAPDDNDSDDCDTVADALVDEIRANPGGFYVNVHTADYPDGAIRGQIRNVAG